jgi:hypothetical protein
LSPSINIYSAAAVENIRGAFRILIVGADSYHCAASAYGFRIVAVVVAQIVPKQTPEESGNASAAIVLCFPRESGVAASCVGGIGVMGVDLNMAAAKAAVYKLFHDSLCGRTIIEYAYNGAG